VSLVLPAAMAVVPSAEAGLRAAGRGATVLLLRDPELSVRRLEEEADTLRTGTATPLLISSRIDVAMAVGAAGVNLPEQDLPVAAARRLLAGGLVGRSVHSLEAARRAEDDGADYVLLGSIFATPSHPGRQPLGLRALAEVAASLRIPVLAIGGIDAGRARACAEAGAAGFAAIRYFLH
jgi:thiamine-phosphate diphosphorylase